MWDSKTLAMAVVLIGGGLAAFQAPANGLLAQAVRSPVNAAFVSFAVASAVLLGAALILRTTPDAAAVRAVPWYGWLGGVYGAVFVTASAFAGRRSAIDCLTAAVYYEAASETITGQRAVAQVVLNRMRHPAYPSSVCGVVFQGSHRATGCQFTFTCDGSLRRRPSASGWLRARSVATAALSGYVEPAVGHATHYHTTYVVPYWSSSLTKMRTVGSHIFYRWSGSNGTPRAFVNRYANAELIPAGAAANLSGYLLGSAALPGGLDLADLPLAAEPVIAAASAPSSGLKAPLRGELSSAPSSEIAVKGGGILTRNHKLKGDVAEPRLVDDRPRLIE